MKIEKLRGKENWLQWCFVMRTLLEEDDDVFNLCKGNLYHPGNAEADEAKRKRFVKADKTARKLIVTAVEKKPLGLLLSCTTAHEMWKKLNTVYDMKSDENLNMVQKQFFDFKWEESENVAHNFSKLEQLAAKMKALGSDVGEKILITRILTTLPKKFNHFHSAWDSVDEGKKTLDSLTTRLITEESRWKENEDYQEASVALVTKGNYCRDQQKQPNTSISEKQGPSCFNCGKVGHLKKDCFRCFICKRKGHISKNCFQNNQKGKGRGNWQSSNPNQEGSNERTTTKLSLLGSSSLTTQTASDAWVIDSGASEHMTGRKEWFSVFEKFDKTVKIEIGGSTFIDACGKGKIEIETFVNGKWLAGTLHDVL